MKRQSKTLENSAVTVAISENRFTGRTGITTFDRFIFANRVKMRGDVANSGNRAEPIHHAVRFSASELADRVFEMLKINYRAVITDARVRTFDGYVRRRVNARATFH